MESSIVVVDNLNVINNQEIVKQLDSGNTSSNHNFTETLIFSGKIKKFNPYDWLQERTLVITKLAIYNFNYNSLQRKILLTDLKGITKSVSSETGEFVLHCTSDYDYRMKAETNRD
jgi:hypothetical protein